ncbi:GntR family transcriptional regulator [Enterovirga sp.]|uniref:GntR family transcriptional regulator n=1 Tax=Enterovirga sp. TaxID=2026350 RepID=UPI002CA48E6B|nr:GntR family transcriptional regulator [Enterovirga sp.]HMO27714.1 GntR family transcriptional regulator [Enterovirga sp.]
MERESSEPPFPWSQRQTLAGEIAQVLRQRIFAGRYAPGQPMLQVPLSEELEVSRTPLRHALSMLEAEGLLQSAGARGLIVAKPNLNDIEQAYLLREVIDGLAARLAAERAEATGIRRLRDIVSEQAVNVKTWRPDAYTHLNVEFHAEIIACSGNSYLDSQLPLVRLTSLVFLPAFRLSEARAIDAVGEHSSIVDAIERHDGSHAETLARAHIRRTLSKIRELR